MAEGVAQSADGAWQLFVSLAELSSDGACLRGLLLPALASLGFGEALSLSLGYTGHARLLVWEHGRCVVVPVIPTRRLAFWSAATKNWAQVELRLLFSFRLLDSDQRELLRVVLAVMNEDGGFVPSKVGDAGLEDDVLFLTH